eukprot:358188-Chlamydomonas_euryale.AAC.2
MRELLSGGQSSNFIGAKCVEIACTDTIVLLVLLRCARRKGAAGTRIAVDHTQRLTDVHKCTNARLLDVNDSWVVASIRISADDVPHDALQRALTESTPRVLFFLQPS